MFIEVPKAKSVLSTTAADRNIATLIRTLTRDNVLKAYTVLVIFF